MRLRRRQRAPGRAAPLYAAAARAFDAAGNHLLADTALLARAEALAEAGQGSEALAAWRKVSAGAAAGGPLGEALALARARVALAGAADGGDGALAEAAADVGARAEQARRRPTTWRASWLASRLYARLGDGRAAGLAERARKMFEEVKMLSPVKFRPGLDADPDVPSAPAAAPPAALPSIGPAGPRTACAGSSASTSASTASCACTGCWRPSSTRSSS